MSDFDFTRLPDTSEEEVALALTRLGLTSLPVIGAPAAEILGLIVTPMINKRRNEWLEALGKALVALEWRVQAVNLERLSQDEVFVTIATHATMLAMRNHQREKLEALRNAVLNATLPSAPDDDLQLIFLNLVDMLTASHLRLLKVLNNPSEWMQRHGIANPDKSMKIGVDLIEWAFPEWRSHRDYYHLLANELYRREMLDNSWNDTVKPSRTSEFGKQFLEFITSPMPAHNTPTDTAC